MCGIVGIYHFKSQGNVAAAALESMCKVIAYRGPDGQGYYYDGAVGLGHKRLTIIDTSERSNQPMESADNTSVICYNGEVYNYLEIKDELVAEGVDFRTTSDTEVILELYRKKGIDCLHRLNGMFAFAIWDKNKQRLFLASDRVGIKPLYYCLTTEGIVFCSEV